MAENDKQDTPKGDPLLKEIVVESFNRCSAENPVARTVQATAERLPTISNSTFSRIVKNQKNPRNATLDEAIEILTLTNDLEMLNRFMAKSSSDGANYLRMLKNKTGEQIKVDFSTTDPIVLMNAINDGFAQTKVELKRKEIIIQRALGIFIGSVITGFLFFYYSNFEFMTKYLWGN